MAASPSDTLEASLSPASVTVSPSVPGVKLTRSDEQREVPSESHAISRDSTQNVARPESHGTDMIGERGAEREEGVAEYAARKLKNALRECRRMKRELGNIDRPQQSCAPVVSADIACPICSNAYDCALTLPLCLPCGHTLCSSCILRLTRKTTLLCPFDRHPFDTDSSPLPVNLSLAHLSSSELSSALCPSHNCQIIAYCISSGSLLCGLCAHEPDHKHILLDSSEVAVLVQEQVIALSQHLTEAWVTAKQISSYSLEVESLILRLTVKFNGFSLMHRATKQQRRLSRKFSDVLLRLRAELEDCQKIVQNYTQTHACIYWNCSSIEKWQWLVWRFQGMPRMAKIGKAMEAMQKWLREANSPVLY